MTIRATLLSIFLSLASIGASAQTIPWIKIRASTYTYNDLTGTCSVSGVTLSAADVFFSAEISGSEIRRGYFKKYPDGPEYRELNSSELGSLKLYQDDKNRFWIREVKLGAPIVTWIMDKLHPTLACMGFTPSIQTVTSDQLSFEFELDAIKEGVYVSYSQQVRFEGETTKGYPYEAKLKLKQERW